MKFAGERLSQLAEEVKLSGTRIFRVGTVNGRDSGETLLKSAEGETRQENLPTNLSGKRTEQEVRPNRSVLRTIGRSKRLFSYAGCFPELDPLDLTLFIFSRIHSERESKNEQTFS
jgi:hypothetical protein